jgi:tetratricopeptide (TPR) repeat protein
MIDGYRLLEIKYRSILSCARHMFSIAITCVEDFISLKEGKKKIEDLDTDIQNYKKEIGKYHKIIMSDSWTNENIVINGAIIEEHKKKFKSALESKNKHDIIEVLLSLRVNALQTNPDLRTNFVDDLIKYDILNITEPKSNQTVIDILNNQEYNIRNAMMSIISIIVSKFEGVQYIISQGEQIIKKIILIMKGTEDGQVLQRFAIAILQKMSVKLFDSSDMDKNEEIKKINSLIINIYNKNNIIDFLIKLFQRNKTNKIHEFCMNYGSALLANILGYKETIDFLFDNLSFYKNITETLLSLIKEKGNNPQVLMHYLMCLNYLSIDKFKMIKEEINFDEQIKTFEEEYRNDTENYHVNKKTVLNLSFLLFHSKQGKELKTDINENIKRKGEPLIFECFRDEIC